jgi:hypothetical protein
MLQDIWKVKTNAWRGQYAVANQRFSFPVEDHHWSPILESAGRGELVSVG